MVVIQQFTKWIKVKSPRFPTSGHPRLYRLAVAIISLGVICGAFSAVAFLVTRIYAINIEESIQENGQVIFWIHGSRQVASDFTVLVPTSNESRCKPVDCASGSIYRAITTMVDWNTLNPQLKITNFSYPQCQGLLCGPGLTIDRLTFRTNPPNIDILIPEHQRKYRVIILIFGGVSWIASICFVIFRSR